jgi:hypothetical protein
MYNKNLSIIVLCLLIPTLLISACSPNRHQSATLEYFSSSNPTHSSVTAFVPQTDRLHPEILFRTLGADSTLFFSLQGITFLLPSSVQTMGIFSNLSDFDRTSTTITEYPSILRMLFEGQNPDTYVIGDNQLAGIVNYFIGNNPADWHTSIPTYGNIEYKELYPGIDLQYSGEEGILKGTFHLAPGADPEVIRWKYQDVARVEILGGDLLITITDGNQSNQLVERKPMAWQMIDGKLISIEVDYTIHPNGNIGFEIDEYDPNTALFIDPTIDYYTYFGGSLAEGIYDIVTDSDDMVYITGRTNSLDLPSPDSNGYVGNFDIFVTKLDPSKDGVNQLVYTTYIGGTDFDIAHGMDMDADGNVYIVGYTTSSDYPATPNAYQGINNGEQDCAFAKIDTTGAVKYASYLGGLYEDQFMDVTIENNGLAYVVGWSASEDFPTTSDAYQDTWGGGEDEHYRADAVIAIFDTSQSGTPSLNYSTFYGGSSHDQGYTIDVTNGIIYFAGHTGSDDLPLVNPIQSTNMGGAYFMELFLAKLDPSKSGIAQLLFGTYLGGKEGGNEYYGPEEVSGAILAQSTGIVFWVGATGSEDFPTTEISPIYGGGDFDAYLVKVDTNTPELVFSRYFGGSGNDGFADILLDPSGNIYAVGATGSDNIQTIDPFQDEFRGGVAQDYENSWYGPGDILLVKFDPNATSIFATYLGGTGVESALGMTADTQGNIYIAGGTQSTDLDIVNPFQSTNAGSYDGFIARISGLLPEPKIEEQLFLPIIIKNP